MLQIDARAGAEVRRLSGGNQQKVTIARWVTDGVHTMLCFDPTRGIDIRTKNQIYILLRDLAEAGAAILLYTSELKEIQLVCDRVIVIFGGKVVAELDARDADEPRLLRAAYNLKADAELPEETIAESLGEAGHLEAALDQATAPAPPSPPPVEAGTSAEPGGEAER
jgi:ABC-type multidrug transport system ATPase subunit